MTDTIWEDFVLTLSPALFYKLACLSQDYTDGKLWEEELIAKCAELGLPADKMKRRLTTIIVDKTMSGETWR